MTQEVMAQILGVRRERVSQSIKGALDASRGMMRLVGLGTSAGGLQALKAFFSRVPLNSGLAYVVLQHMGPDHKTSLSHLLSRVTRLSVHDVQELTVVQANAVYAYTLAMVFQELKDSQPSLQGLRIQIFATDLNTHAIAVARKAWYCAKAVQGLDKKQMDMPVGSSGVQAMPSPDDSLVQELHNAREEILTLRHEMKTFKETLQASNESLQSMNEELQSANEELTTSKEEGQSMNEELQTLNGELQSRLDELALAQSDMQNLLNSTDIATLFLDNDLNVRRYTEQAEAIFHFREGDVGRPLSDLANTLDYPDLKLDLMETLRTLTPWNASGTWIDATQALRVLFDLAANADTAADALALLHELQVHQVELDLQTEELSQSLLQLDLLMAQSQRIGSASKAQEGHSYLELSAYAKAHRFALMRDEGRMVFTLKDAQGEPRSGLALLEEIKAHKLKTRPIVFTGAPLGEVMRAIDLDIPGLVSKEKSSQVLTRCIKSVHEGGKWLDRDLTVKTMSLLLEQQKKNSHASQLLTPREMMVARMQMALRHPPINTVAFCSPTDRNAIIEILDAGAKGYEIARNLQIAPSTVEVHRRNIMRKVGLHKVADLTRYAIRNQMVSI
eukprot:gene4249-4160_t